MDWRHKMRKAWFAVSSRVKFRKSGSGGGRGDAARRSASGLLKLQDDVQMCGYRDVEVMWKMFIESNPEQMAASVMTSTSKTPTTSKQSQMPSSLRLTGKFLDLGYTYVEPTINVATLGSWWVNLCPFKKFCKLRLIWDADLNFLHLDNPDCKTMVSALVTVFVFNEFLRLGAYYALYTR
ncbi:unnamed protein product [Dovyalis caffra]|uniref:Uncharacterized protein n=1 Tax=Dovyalis caffra TaxID=77055 RepID=A0AAV1S5E0_9ROSI|nr:unnamed protein product [Dovyalis caffra]